eukprot:107286_1
MSYVLITDCDIDEEKSRCVVKCTRINRKLNTQNKDSVAYHLSNEWYHLIRYLSQNTHPHTQLSIAMQPAKSDSDPHDNIYEFRSNVQRICGQNGISLSANKIRDSNCFSMSNIEIPEVTKPFIPLAEVQPTRGQGYVVGIVTKSSDVRHCRGFHSYSKQIRIRDASLSDDSYDFEVMLFDHSNSFFPDCAVNDIIKFERITIKWRTAYTPFYQGTAALCDGDAIFAVIDPISGHLKHSNHMNYKLDNMDQYWLHLTARTPVQSSNQIVRSSNDNDNVNSTSSTTTCNEIDDNIGPISQKMLCDIRAEDERFNILVMITDRFFPCAAEDVDPNDKNYDFYWVIWDGSDCTNNKHLFETYEGTDEENACRMEVDEGKASTTVLSYKEAKHIGSKVRLFVNLTEDDEWHVVSCINLIDLGQWAYFQNIRLDNDSSQLIYDVDSTIYGAECLRGRHHAVRDMKQDLLVWNLYQKARVVTDVSSINPHHYYQSLSMIRSVNDINRSHCKYRIMGKVVEYFPKDMDQFIQWNDEADRFKRIVFALRLRDASGDVIPVFFADDEALIFLGISDKCMSLSREAVLEEVRFCMKIIMNDSSMIDVCIRSYKSVHRNVICYKAFDTVLIK